MSNPSRPASDSSQHRKYKPGKTGSSFAESAPAQSEPSLEAAHDWGAALSALEQNYGARLADLEERLATAEREVSNLGGQIKELR